MIPFVNGQIPNKQKNLVSHEDVQLFQQFSREKIMNLYKSYKKLITVYHIG